MSLLRDAGGAPVIPFAETGATVQRVWADQLSVPLDRLTGMHGSARVQVVRVHIRDTDGSTGTGFTYTLGSGASVVLAMVRDVIAPALEGVPLTGIQTTLRDVSASTRRLGRAVFAPALSATDIAAWDLCGHVRNAPLVTLLGGTPDVALPIYGSGRGSNELADAELVDQSIGYVEAGLGAVKVRVGTRDPRSDIARVAAVRSALPGISLLVDANERLSEDAALTLVAGLHEQGVDWLEEPFPAEDVDAHRRLADRTDLAIAVGEHLVGPTEMLMWIQAGAAQVMQPDAALCGGVTSAVAAALVMPATEIAFHSLPELHVHLAAALPNAGTVEHFPLLDAALAEPLKWLRGTVSPSSRPGTGMRWDDDVVRSTRVATTEF